MANGLEAGFRGQSIAMGGKGKSPETLIERFPSPDLVAKAGTNWMYSGDCSRTIVRRNAKV